jgi:Flp pilus assembly protein TadD
VLKGNPSDGRALLLKGKALLAKGDRAAGLAVLQAAVKAAPEAAEAHIMLAQAQAMGGKPAEARQTLQQALKANPDNPELRRALVRACLAEGDAGAAKAELDRLLAANPRDVQALTDLGGLHVARGEMPQAERCFKTLAEINPKDHLAHYRLGLLAAQAGRFDDAAKSFVKSYELSPDFGIAATALVQTYLARREPDKAAAWLKGRLAARPRDAWLHNLMGELQVVLGDMAASERHLTSAQTYAPGWATPYNNLALLYARTGQIEPATARLKGEFQKAHSVRAGHMLAMLQEINRDWAGARATYEQVLKFQPDFVLSANNLAYLLAEVYPGPNTLQQADLLAQKALARAPGDPYVLDTAGWVAYRRGELPKARSLLERAVALQPQVPVFNYHLGMLCLKEGNQAQAKRHLQRALESGQGFQGMEEAKKALDKLG